MAVLTIARKDIMMEPVTSTTNRNFWLSLSILSLAVFFIGMYARSLSHPLRSLTDASKDISEGNFEVKLKPKTHDELGVLTQSFVNMGKGLAEREHLKDSFTRFTNKAVAEKAAAGELNLGGEIKVVTIFFSDIRSFTAMSEKLSPTEVVEFLNDYMTRMVECVNKTAQVTQANYQNRLRYQYRLCHFRTNWFHITHGVYMHRRRSKLCVKDRIS